MIGSRFIFSGKYGIVWSAYHNKSPLAASLYSMVGTPSWTLGCKLTYGNRCTMVII